MPGPLHLCSSGRLVWVRSVQCVGSRDVPRSSRLFLLVSSQSVSGQAAWIRRVRCVQAVRPPELLARNVRDKSTFFPRIIGPL